MRPEVERLLSLGCAVFPCRTNDKRPATARGFYDATHELDVADRMFGGRPYNVGIACDPSGILVVDVDSKNDGDVTYRSLERGPETWTVRTPSGGWHEYYRAPHAAALRSTLGPGIDIKCAGGYVLAVGSSIDGRPYTWEIDPSEVPLARLPDSWLARIVDGRTHSDVTRSDGNADSWLRRAFYAAGWLGPDNDRGRTFVRCPWANTHSDGRGFGKDGSSVIFAPTDQRTTGWFECKHSHCTTRTLAEVMRQFPAKIKQIANAA